MKQRLLPDILEELITQTLFTISYKTAVDNGDGTFTLSGICDIKYIQPGFTITINGNSFVVSDYFGSENDWNIILLAGSNSLPSAPASFQLYSPFFVHGTPMETETELTKIPLDNKTPMIYLMEPFVTDLDYSFDSSIDRRCSFTLCFLTQADIPKWLTDDFYHKAITPMYNLAQDFINLCNDSPLFYSVKQKGSVKFHTKFGINIKETGTKKLYFSENLSGVSLVLDLAIYKEDACCGNEKDNGLIKTKMGKYLYATTPDNSKDPVLIGAVDGVNKTFVMPIGNFYSGDVDIHVDGSYQRDFFQNNLTRTVILSFAPPLGSVVSSKYFSINT